MAPLLDGLAALRPQAFFVHVGANDGQQQDPLREVVLRSEWSGIMVEPVPYVFERLRRNYGRIPRIKLENVAIAEEDGERLFYHVAEAPDAGRPGLPLWADALGSFRREVVLSHRRFIPDIDQRIVETAVPCLTLDSLCRRHGVEGLDVLLTDTEGYDYEIVRSVDLDRLRPAIVIYEHFHLTPSEQTACVRHLHDHGFETFYYGLDVWGFNSGSLSPEEAGVLVPLWRWLVDSYPDQPLAATRALRATARRVLTRGRAEADQLERWFGLSDAERRYLINGYDDRTPLPPGAVRLLRNDNPRLRELRTAYEGLDLPAVHHHMWTSSRVDANVDLRYFRGDNLYQWHYPDHPRAMALALFVYMRYLEQRGGRRILELLREDGAFGCWTTEVAGYGKVSRDLLDSTNEIMFLDRRLALMSRPGLRVLDIGAGYGRLAHRMATALPGLADYCCVDAVPESTFLSEYYLAFRDCSPRARVVTLEDVERTLRPGMFDLAVNVHSFSECTIAAISWWVEQLRRLGVPWLFVVPNEADGILSREPDGGYRDVLPVLEAAGYVQTVVEPVITDPAAQELVGIYDLFHLFALDGQRES